MKSDYQKYPIGVIIKGKFPHWNTYYKGIIEECREPSGGYTKYFFYRTSNRTKCKPLTLNFEIKLN